jgi:cytochrome P450
MSQETLLQHIVDYKNRANPYPLYAELRKTPVSRQVDGTYVVSTYREIVALLGDPRVSSDLRNRAEPATGETRGAESPPVEKQQSPSSFLLLDPPEHDRLRRLATRQFGPPHRPDLVNRMRPDLTSPAPCTTNFFCGGVFATVNPIFVRSTTALPLVV